MIAVKSPEWPDAIKNLLKANNFDTKKTLEAMGQSIQGQLRQSIRDTNTPPLKPATIRRKGHAKPLIDSGKMLDSVNFVVED
jgi:hypothetical protein